MLRFTGMLRWTFMRPNASSVSTTFRTRVISLPEAERSPSVSCASS